MPGEKKGCSQILIMFGIMLVVTFMSIALSMADDNDCQDPCPSGDTAAAISDPADPQIQDLMASLSAYNDPAAFLAANAVQLDALRAKLVTLKADVTAKKASLASLDPAVIVPLLDKMIGELDGVRQKISAQDGATKDERKKLAEQFLADVKTLNSLLPAGAIACQSGGKCLDVPVVNQGKGNWCGKTSLIMMMMFYTKGQITGPLNGFVTTVNGRLISAGGINGDYVTTGNIEAVAPAGHKGWTKTAGPKGADQMYQMIKKSIDGGDPILLYTYGMFYTPTSNHIVTIVGYNDTNQSIYVNNSAVLKYGGTSKATNTGIGTSVLTKDYVYDRLGARYKGYSGHSFMVREAYL